MLEADEPFIAIDLELPLEKPPCGGSGEALVGVVGFDQEELVGERVGGRKLAPMSGSNFEGAASHPDGEQSSHLGARKAGHVLEVGP